MFSDLLNWYLTHADKLGPAATLAGSLVTLSAALVAAWIALARHRAQTESDIQRRITETYSRAIAQLASDNIEERLGGIYTLERISKESIDDHWTVMETLSAFVREKSRHEDFEYQNSHERVAQQAYILWNNAGRPEGQSEEFWAKAIQFGEPPPSDIAAILAVIHRRRLAAREREKKEMVRFDLKNAILRYALFFDIHLESADLRAAHLEHANFHSAHLERANLAFAHLESADLLQAHFEHAFLQNAHLEGADLIGTHLEGAYLPNAHLQGANLFNAKLTNAHLKGANLQDANLEAANLRYACLEDANLQGTHLERVDLSNTLLKGANFQGAYLDGAKLPPAYEHLRTLYQGISNSC